MLRCKQRAPLFYLTQCEARLTWHGKGDVKDPFKVAGNGVVAQHPSFMATNLQANIDEKKTRTQSLQIKEASSLCFHHGGSIYLTLIVMYFIYSFSSLAMKDNYSQICKKIIFLQIQGNYLKWDLTCAIDLHRNFVTFTLNPLHHLPVTTPQKVPYAAENQPQNCSHLSSCCGNEHCKFKSCT